MNVLLKTTRLTLSTPTRAAFADFAPHAGAVTFPWSYARHAAPFALLAIPHRFVLDLVALLKTRFMVLLHNLAVNEDVFAAIDWGNKPKTFCWEKLLDDS